MKKRLRILWAAMTQRWFVFTCPKCGNASYVCGNAFPLTDGLICEECEGIQFDAWVQDFQARHESEMEVV